MTRFGFLSFVFLTAIVSNVGAAPIWMKRAVTQTAANFKELA